MDETAFTYLHCSPQRRPTANAATTAATSTTESGSFSAVIQKFFIQMKESDSK